MSHLNLDGNASIAQLVAKRPESNLDIIGTTVHDHQVNVTGGQIQPCHIRFGQLATGQQEPYWPVSWAD